MIYAKALLWIAAWYLVVENFVLLIETFPHTYQHLITLAALAYATLWGSTDTYTQLFHKFKKRS
jgi:hypothetical protein